MRSFLKYVMAEARAPAAAASSARAAAGHIGAQKPPGTRSGSQYSHSTCAMSRVVQERRYPRGLPLSCPCQLGLLEFDSRNFLVKFLCNSETCLSAHCRVHSSQCFSGRGGTAVLTATCVQTMGRVTVHKGWPMDRTSLSCMRHGNLLWSKPVPRA